MNYIFDFGNVLVRFDPVHITRCYVSPETPDDVVKEISKVIFDRKYWDLLDLGTVTEAEVLPEIRSRIPVQFHETAEQILTTWYEHLPEEEGMRRYLLELKGDGHRLYLLSNISERFEKNWRTVPALCELLSLFDGIVCSGSLHLVKPGAEIFRYLLEKYVLDPVTCRFMDDNPGNVNAAEHLGIRSTLFTGCPLLKEHEVWDVYDVDRMKTGRTMIRGMASDPGDYHLVVHVGLFNERGEMLIQKRQPFKAGYPGLWDVTLGGSATAGESSRIAVERELLEELGIEMDFTGVRPFFTSNFERGFDDFYLAQAPEGLDITTLKLQESEVECVRWASQEEILQMIENKTFIPYYRSLIMLMFDNRKHYGAHDIEL